MALFVLDVWWIQKPAHAEEVEGMRENREMWMELCEQAANEQDSEKLMELVKQITALLEAKAKQEQPIEGDSPNLNSERRDE